VIHIGEVVDASDLHVVAMQLRPMPTQYAIVQHTTTQLHYLH
jgi:hypothetical protein